MLATSLMTPAFLYNRTDTQTSAPRGVRDDHIEDRTSNDGRSTYCHVEPLSDPVRESDMQQTEQIFRFRVLLRLRFADRDDVLVSGWGYLRSTAGPTPLRDMPPTAWWRSESIRAR